MLVIWAVLVTITGPGRSSGSSDSAPARPERLLLPDVPDVQAVLGALADAILDHVGHVVDGEPHVVDSGRMQILEHPFEDRGPADLQQARDLTACQTY